MKRTLLTMALIAATNVLVAAPWTFRGTLDDGGKPANGSYDLRLTLLNEASSASVTHPVTLYAVVLKDGQFAVEVDFGIELRNAPAMNLKTEVQHGSSGFLSLGEPTRFDPKAALAGVCWDTEGNAGTNAATDFIGTTDNEPLVFRTRNVRSLRIEPSAELFSGTPITANIIAGSSANTASAGTRGVTIAGGGTPSGNSDPNYTGEGPNLVSDHYGTIGGGFSNLAGNIFGGPGDRTFATVSGGANNDAVGAGSSIGGGTDNSAIGYHGVVGGGLNNVANGHNSTVSGGYSNCAGGDYSWAGGNHAAVRVSNDDDVLGCAPSSSDGDGDEGTFIWADFSSNSDFASTGANQFLVRADGGVGFNTNAIGSLDDMVVAARGSGDDSANLRLRPASGRFVNLTANDASGTLSIAVIPDTGEERLTVSGLVGGTASLSNGGTWTNASSRSYKENFAAVDSSDVLRRVIALPLMSWDYKGSSEGRHLGPVAEDFKASFGLAGDGRSISTVDADGVALAAIQGLNEKLERENAALQAQTDALRARFQALERRMR